MSGGAFDYKQYGMTDIAGTLWDTVIEVENGDREVEHKEEFLKMCRELAVTMDKAFLKVQAMDYFLKGDYGFDSLKTAFEEADASNKK